MEQFDPISITARHLQRAAMQGADRRALLRSCGCSRVAPMIGRLMMRAGTGLANLGCRVSFGVPCPSPERASA